MPKSSWLTQNELNGVFAGFRFLLFGDLFCLNGLLSICFGFNFYVLMIFKNLFLVPFICLVGFGILKKREKEHKIRWVGEVVGIWK